MPSSDSTSPIPLALLPRDIQGVLFRLQPIDQMIENYISKQKGGNVYLMPFEALGIVFQGDDPKKAGEAICRYFNQFNKIVWEWKFGEKFKSNSIEIEIPYPIVPYTLMKDFARYDRKYYRHPHWIAIKGEKNRTIGHYSTTSKPGFIVGVYYKAKQSNLNMEFVCFMNFCKGLEEIRNKEIQTVRRNPWKKVLNHPLSKLQFIMRVQGDINMKLFPLFFLWVTGLLLYFKLNLSLQNFILQQSTRFNKNISTNSYFTTELIFALFDMVMMFFLRNAQYPLYGLLLWRLFDGWKTIFQTLYPSKEARMTHQKIEEALPSLATFKFGFFEAAQQKQNRPLDTPPSFFAPD